MNDTTPNRFGTQPMAGRTFHMVGIGGAGVSGLAQLASALGATVSGCDRARSAFSDLVEQVGVPVAIGHDAAHVVAGSELIVSSAIDQQHPEIVRARELGVPVILRGELLGELTRSRDTVVVAGAHGKSTTTAMIAQAMVASGLDPAMALGAELPKLGGNVRTGKGPWFVVEGDESDRTLLRLSAKVAVVTNIERDHHHTFVSDDDVFELFRCWVEGLGPEATLVAGPGATLDRLAAMAPGTVVRFGQDERELRSIAARLSVPGRHNALNAAAALAVLEIAGVERAAGLDALADFTGVGRRFQVIGRANGVTIVDDYAHHPTEVSATIDAARSRLDSAGSTGRVVVVFQPHLYSRTQALAGDFAAALAGADLVVLLPIYAAREAPIEGVSAETIGDELRRIAGGRFAGVLPVDPATGNVMGILNLVMDGDSLITMGAGDVTQLAPRLVMALSEAADSGAHGVSPETAAAGAGEGVDDARDDPAWLERNVMLHRFTTIGTGGRARYFARVPNEQVLAEALAWASERDLPLAMIGLGSNSLIVDRGFDGLAMKLVDDLAHIEIDEDQATVRCGGGASLAAIVRRCRDAGLSGFEFACAIPGTVGGAVKMNAGAYGGEMVDVLGQVRFVSADGVREATPDELGMTYRHTNIPWSDVVSEATFQLHHGDPDQIRLTVKEMQGRRTASQPRAARSFGSVFQNPPASPDGEPVLGAGALIEQAGLKGRTIGGACISPKHANFIENLGDATTADIVALIDLARRTVRERFGVTLHTEVHLLDRDGYRPILATGVTG